MKKNNFFISLFVVSTLSSGDIVMSWSDNAKNNLPEWKRVEQQLKKNAAPLQKNLKNLTGNDSLEVKVTYSAPSPAWSAEGFVFSFVNYGASTTLSDLYFRISIPGEHALIPALFIVPAYQRKGLGRQCITIFDEHIIAQLLGYKELYLTSEPEAQEFYKKLGFTCKQDLFYSKNITPLTQSGKEKGA